MIKIPDRSHSWKYRAHCGDCIRNGEGILMSLLSHILCTCYFSFIPCLHYKESSCSDCPSYSTWPVLVSAAGSSSKSDINILLSSCSSVTLQVWCHVGYMRAWTEEVQHGQKVINLKITWAHRATLENELAVAPRTYSYITSLALQSLQKLIEPARTRLREEIQ